MWGACSNILTAVDGDYCVKQTWRAEVNQNDDRSSRLMIDMAQEAARWLLRALAVLDGRVIRTLSVFA